MKWKNGKLRLVLLAFFALTTCASAQGQDEDPWAKYTPDKLSEVIKAHTFRNMQNERGVDIGSHPLRARVIYSGKSRPIPSDKKSLIKFWMQSNKYSEEILKMFDKEFLFLEDSREYWLPVQNVLIPHFKEEMHEGESVDLFAAWIGITFAKPGKRQHVLLVNEFEKPEQTKPTKPKAQRRFQR
ncbi:MAG TPA: hypothetical protein VE056_13490 [Pyrinomonadaceae bacterium]|nr:hypothetical protein [Pyrinomonadaceae bacterium]